MKYSVSFSAVMGRFSNKDSKGISQRYFALIKDLQRIRKENNLDGVELLCESPANADMLFHYSKIIKMVIPGTFNSLHLPFTEMNIASMDETVRNYWVKEAKKYMDFCSGSGIRVLVIHPGIFTHIHEIFKDLFFGYYTKTVSDLIGYSKKKKVNLCFENMTRDEIFFKRPEEMLFFEKIGGDTCLDVGHAITDGHDPIAFFDINKKSIRHIHLHSDYKSKSDDHLPLGEGDFDYVSFIRHIELAGFPGMIVLELNSEEDVIKSIRIIREMK